MAAEPVTPRSPSWSHSPSQVFSDIGAIQSLKRLVSYSTNGTTSALAKRALRLLGEEVPRPIVPCVGSWKEAEVQTWLQQIGFAQYCDSFRVRALPRHMSRGRPARKTVPPLYPHPGLWWGKDWTPSLFEVSYLGTPIPSPVSSPLFCAGENKLGEWNPT